MKVKGKEQYQKPRVLHEITRVEKSRKRQRSELERVPGGRVSRHGISGSEGHLFQFKGS